MGQHTIHLLPYSTAAFSPSVSTSDATSGSCHCLDSENLKAEIFLPIIFNNTEPQFLSYSVTPFPNSGTEEKEVFNVTIPRNALIRLGTDKSQSNRKGDILDLELDDADTDDDATAGTSVRQRETDKEHRQTSSKSHDVPSNSHPKSQAMMYKLPIRKTGRIRIERVLDRNRFDAKLSKSEILVVDCPKAGFISEHQLSTRSSLRQGVENVAYCPEQQGEIDVWVSGLAPLELRYRRTYLSGRAERSDSFTVSHISSNVSPDLVSHELVDVAGHRVAREQNPLGNRFDPEGFTSNVTLPITIDTSRSGIRRYVLDEVRDACGNVLHMDTSAKKFAKDVKVFSRPVVSFVGCKPDSPINLLQGGDIKLIAAKVQGEDGPYVAKLRFEGNSGQNWTRNLTIQDQTSKIEVKEPGVYTLDELRGTQCSGEIGSDWTCTAIELPRPTASIVFDPIQDQCAGPVGVKALAELSGTPPFKVKYKIKKKDKEVQEHEQIVLRTREEIEFRPSSEGQVTYTFVGLSDANYENIPLDGPTFTQTLHPVASAIFEGTSGTQGPSMEVHSCHGNTAKSHVHFSGVGPFELTYAMRTSAGELIKSEKVKDIKSSRFPFDFEVPSPLSENGGVLTVSLTSVKDAKGCERPLTIPDLTVVVHRSKPSVGFIDPRDTSILEGKKAKLPIRLAGQGPWTVRYGCKGDEGKAKTIEARLQQSEGFLVVDEPGEYYLDNVHDAQCPGIIQKGRSEHVVTMKPRPKAEFVTQDLYAAKNALVRRPVCVGTSDSTMLQLDGHYPVSISYTHQSPTGNTQQLTFTSAQNSTQFHLSTEIEGLHVYELQQIGDAVYPLYADGTMKPGRRLEQEVYPLPTAQFFSKSAPQKLSLCLGDSLTASDRSSLLPTVTLGGTPPFSLKFAIKDSMGVIRKTITRHGIDKPEYSLSVDPTEFQFDDTGRWSTELLSVRDAHSCERTISGDGRVDIQQKGIRQTLEVDVVETANISPLGTRSDYCVGETIDFVLQGSPPWTITYNFDGKTSQAQVKSTTFSRIAEHPGILSVEAIGHQQNKCKTNVSDRAGMKKTVHALPSVQIRGGSHYIEDLREGNQAEIVFKFTGVAPFSFTYQRTQAIDRYSKPQVLETHTVTGINKDTYTITTSDEGTWSIIWLQDKWCAVSLDMRAGRATPLGEARQVT